VTPSPHLIEKQCTACFETLPLSSFWKRADMRSGYASGCKACATIKKKLYRPNCDKGKYAALKDRKGPEWSKQNIRRIGFSKFKVNQAWYEEKLASQDGKCAICGSESNHQRWARFCIDHNHECCPKHTACEKCRRGLLCHRCNIRLGMIEDSEWIAKALAYLVRHNKDLSVAFAQLPSFLTVPSEQPHSKP